MAKNFCAYEGDETRQLALDLNFIPVVPPKSNRINAWAYDREMYYSRPAEWVLSEQDAQAVVRATKFGA
jgi:hypothetical protein